MNRSFAAVDLGATSGRVVVGTFATEGFGLEEVHRFPNEPIFVEGVRCWNHRVLFEETLNGLTKAVAVANDRGAPLNGIGVDSWGVDYGLVDGESSLIFPARHYRAAQESTVESAKTLVPTDEAYRRTGIIESPINTSFQWVRDSQAGLLGPGVTALMTPDLWTAWLTGERRAERTIASTTGLLDWATKDWAFDLMDRYGIPRSIVTPLVDSGSLAGRTLPHITTRIGAHDPIQVFHVGAHDTASAFAAVTDSADNSIVISCGTWALVGCLHHEPLLDSRARSHGFTNEIAADGSALIVRNLSGTWLLDECFRRWAEDDAIGDPAALREELLAAVRGGNIEVRGTFDCGSPALVGTSDMPGEINRLYQEATGQGSLDRRQMIALILTSLAHSFQDTIEKLQELTSIAPKHIVMIGGGSRIESLVHLTSAVTGLPVIVSYQEAASIGSICIQAAAAGLFDSVQDARKFVATTLGDRRND